MPPLESVPGAHYAITADSDYEDLMSRAKQGEFDVMEVLDDTNQKTFLFAPADRVDDIGLLLPSALMEGVVRGTMLHGNLIIARGKEL